MEDKIKNTFRFCIIIKMTRLTKLVKEQKREKRIFSQFFRAFLGEGERERENGNDKTFCFDSNVQLFSLLAALYLSS